VELAQVVAAAVRERTPELELLVRKQVDAELRRLPSELKPELAARRNGGTTVGISPVEDPSVKIRRSTDLNRHRALGAAITGGGAGDATDARAHAPRAAVAPGYGAGWQRAPSISSRGI
jgi:hypothetical protein